MISFSTFSTMHINLLETKKWGVKIQNEKQKLVAAKWGGVKMRRRRRRMTKFTKTPDHNQNTLSGGFEKPGLSISMYLISDFDLKIL